jgi:hypothetical protein
MDRWGLVEAVPSPDGVVYSARREHPDAELVHKLVRSKPPRVLDANAREVRGHLAAQGAPLRADEPTTPTPPFDELVAKGVELARRDPDVARTMPVFLFQNRDAALAAASRSAIGHVGHRFGFFLALAGRLAKDPQMQRAATVLRDGRVKQQDLFENASLGGGSRKNFPLARAWGFHAGTDMEWFKGLFDKFVEAESS